ncbi:hypothetical protein [Henriciella aquimarina]|uniref:hypothetical protein n=1 Tax=Henriciella aquimarina TaxID=545261 RepID=UPI00117B660C|nr:hypothetical protein [Henriciella aquimarina]
MTHYPTDNSAVSETAWESVMFAAVNAGLEQGIFGRCPQDVGSMSRRDPTTNVHPEYHALYSFQHAGRNFKARVRTHFGGAELRIDVWVLREGAPAGKETGLGWQLKDGFDVIASGWLERENDFYLHGQCSPRELRARRYLRPILKSCSVRIPHFHVRLPVGCSMSRREYA